MGRPKLMTLDDLLAVDVETYPSPAYILSSAMHALSSQQLTNEQFVVMHLVCGRAASRLGTHRTQQDTSMRHYRLALDAAIRRQVSVALILSATYGYAAVQVQRLHYEPAMQLLDFVQRVVLERGTPGERINFGVVNEMLRRCMI